MGTDAEAGVDIKARVKSVQRVRIDHAKSHHWQLECTNHDDGREDLRPNTWETFPTAI
jgi:hypothetical protein